MSLPIAAPQRRLVLPPPHLLPPSVAPIAKHWNEVQARYIAADLGLQALSSPRHDKVAQEADDAGILAAAKDGQASPGRPATAALEADRKAAADELEAATALLLDRYDQTLAAIRAATEEGRHLTREHIDTARASLDQYLDGIETLHVQWRRSLRLAGWWESIGAGKASSFNNDPGVAGSIQIAGQSVAHADPRSLLEGFRREADTVASLLDKANMPTAEPEPELSEYIEVLTADRTALRRIKRSDAAAPVATRPTPPAA